MNPYIADAVKQLIEYLNDRIGTPDEFMADQIKIVREDSGFGTERWVVSAHRLKSGGRSTAFKYAWYVTDSQIIADGY